MKRTNHNARNLSVATSTITEGLREKFDSYVDYFYQPCRYDGFAISIQIFKRRFELVLRWSGMDHGRFRDGVHVGFLAGR
jgi:hypothetical protein